MDLAESQEIKNFRREVREFIAEEFTSEMRAKLAKSLTGYMDKEAHVAWQKALDKKGWIVPNWPEEHGGPGWGPLERYVFETELASAGCPRVVSFGPKMVAPVIMQFGSADQKAYHLPRIRRTDDWWCQGYSEPGSGSDLASLQTSAVSDGDDYVVNGSKIWTTRAQDADWIFCLVRTSREGKRQEGISFLLIDMTTPGIRVEPIILVDGSPAGMHEVNQVFFDDVRVPKSNRIGEENKGWTYAKYLLEFERGNAYAGNIHNGLNRVKAIARQENVSGGRLIDDPDFRRQLAVLETELAAVEYTELRVLSALTAGQRPGAESSLLKTRGTEMVQAVSELAVTAAGYYAVPYSQDYYPFGSNQPPVGSEKTATATPKYLNQRKASIYGGSNEIQRNIMAKLILQL